MFTKLFLEEKFCNIYSMIIKLIKSYVRLRINSRMNW